MTRISFTDLEHMLADVDISDEDIAEYLEFLPNDDNPFEPLARPDPDKVEVRGPLEEFQAEAAVASRAVSTWARWRRRRRFERALRDNSKPILYAEGDSWLQFPFLYKDLVDQLDADHLIHCTSQPGDTLKNMVFSRRGSEYLRELNDLLRNRQLPVKAFLFSGAGNDVVGVDDNGEATLARIVRRYEPSQSIEWHIETDGLIETLAFIEKAYLKVLNDIEESFSTAEFPDFRVVIHGYDYSPTRGVPDGDPKRPRYARDWTGKPLTDLGFPDNATASKVVAVLIDRLNELTARVCGAFPRAVFADLRGAVSANAWADELHPNNTGFANAAEKFRTFL
ncbi:hypothetical protein [Aquisalimonas sp.]|uniref:hypothetical protein n=1 Tax=Aquisalimonas sp. TaxID=1872621 RepID=UPI0025C0D41F|nr:hypothetical protein [Aquisalimonas sp.]